MTQAKQIEDNTNKPKCLHTTDNNNNNSNNGTKFNSQPQQQRTPPPPAPTANDPPQYRPPPHPHLNRLPSPYSILPFLDHLQDFLSRSLRLSDAGKLLQRRAFHVARGEACRGRGVDAGGSCLCQACEDTVQDKGLARTGAPFERRRYEMREGEGRRGEGGRGGGSCS